MNLVLIGFRCTGKTAVGKAIADMTGRGFCDMDKSIEALAGCSIDQMVAEKGWAYFRKMEREFAGEISKREDLVIATGGGVVLDEGNTANLKRNGLIVFLKGDPQVLKERMEKDRDAGKIRPALTGDDPLDEITEILKTRNPFYEKAADLMVDTTGLSVWEVAETIVERLGDKTGKSGT